MATIAELKQQVEELEKQNTELKAQIERFTPERLLQCFEDTYAVHKQKLWTSGEYECQKRVWQQIINDILKEE